MLVVGSCRSQQLTKWVVGVGVEECSDCVCGGLDVSMDVWKAEDVFVGIHRFEWADGQQYATRKLEVLLGYLPVCITDVVWGVARTSEAVVELIYGDVVDVVVASYHAVLDVAVVVGCFETCYLGDTAVAITTVVGEFGEVAGIAELSGIAVGVIDWVGQFYVAAFHKAVGLVVTIGGGYAVLDHGRTVTVFSGIGVGASGSTAGIQRTKVVSVAVAALGCRNKAVGIVVSVVPSGGRAVYGASVTGDLAGLAASYSVAYGAGAVTQGIGLAVRPAKGVVGEV